MSFPFFVSFSFSLTPFSPFFSFSSFFYSLFSLFFSYFLFLFFFSFSFFLLLPFLTFFFHSLFFLSLCLSLCFICLSLLAVRPFIHNICHPYICPFIYFYIFLGSRAAKPRILKNCKSNQIPTKLVPLCLSPKKVENPTKYLLILYSNHTCFSFSCFLSHPVSLYRFTEYDTSIFLFFLYLSLYLSFLCEVYSLDSS